MWNDEHYADAKNFRADRFLVQRQERGMENASQFITTHKLATGFGHGYSACPGRFLASSIIKIAVIHILVKYDLRLVDDLPYHGRGLAITVPEKKQFSFRRRKADIDLDSLAGSTDL